MDNSPVSKYSNSFGLALAVTSVVNALIVIVKEKSPAVQAGMKSLTGHHWITHSIIVVLLFLALGGLLAKTNGGQGVKLSLNNLLRTLVSGVILGGLIILGFYLFAD
jgi:hypothetical protein